MKNIFFLLFTLLLSCNASSSEKLTSEASKDSSKPVETCEYDNRHTVDELSKVAGVILKSGNFYLITVGDTRYLPCNMPNDWKEDGKAVNFSAEVKKIEPNERWAGTPIKLLLL